MLEDSKHHVDGEDVTYTQRDKPVPSQQQKKPLSFSISRILSEPDDKRRPDVTSREPDYVSRVPKLHGATVHHYAPETEHYTHFGMWFSLIGNIEKFVAIGSKKLPLSHKL